MILPLRLLFAAVLLGMLATITWASGACALFDIPREVFAHPWFVATLADAYFAFTAFWVWVAWKEQSLAARLLWFVAIMLWGNVAIATYMLVELFRVNAADPASLTTVFTTRRPGRVALPAVFTVLGLAVYLLGAKNLLA